MCKRGGRCCGRGIEESSTKADSPRGSCILRLRTTQQRPGYTQTKFLARKLEAVLSSLYSTLNQRRITMKYETPTLTYLNNATTSIQGVDQGVGKVYTHMSDTAPLSPPTRGAYDVAE
jgi:hypothetical protein